jgi:hypothetical protein
VKNNETNLQSYNATTRIEIKKNCNKKNDITQMKTKTIVAKVKMINFKM